VRAALPAVWHKLIVGYELHEPAADGLTLARLLAHAVGAQLLLAHVVPRTFAADGPWLTRERDARERADAERLLERLRSELATELQVEVRVHPSASVPRGLHDLARAEGADLIVLGSSRRGAIGRVLTGSVAERLIQGAPCAVAVAPRGFAGRTARLRDVAVAFDGSPQSRIALREAAALAGAAGARLRLIAAVEPLVFPAFVNVPSGDGYAALVRARRDFLERETEAAAASLPAGIEAEVRVVDGGAIESICRELEDGADLLVVGSRGWGPVRRVLLGSVSARLLHVASCPVLVVPRGVDPGAGGAAGAAGAAREPAPAARAGR